MAIGGLELAKLFVRIRGDASGLDNDLSNVRKKVTNTIRDISAGAASVLGAFAAFGKSILSQGLAAAGGFEQMMTSMEVLIGSAGEAKKTMESLINFANETPLDVSSVQQMGLSLIQSGERGDHLIETMKILGDAAGGDTQKFKMLAMVFDQVRGVGKLLTQDFRQMATRGIISLQDLADHFGVTQAEAQRMMTSGEITFDDLRAALKGLTEDGGRMAGMMKKQSETMVGLQTRFANARKSIIRYIATPLLPFVKEALKIMIKMVGALKDVIKQNSRAISFAFAGATAFSALGAALFGTAFAAKLLGITIRKALIGTGVGVLIIAMGAALGYVISQMQGVGSAASFVGDILASIRARFQPAIDAVRGFFADNKGKFREMGFFISDIFSTIGEAIMSLVDLANSAFESLTGESVTSSLVGLAQSILDTVHHILDMLSLLSTNWQLTWEYLKVTVKLELLKMLDSVIDFFMQIPSMAYKGFVAVVDIIGKIVVAAAQGINNAVAMLIEGIGNMVHNVGVQFELMIRVVIGMFKALWEGIKNKFKGGSFAEGFAETFNKELAKATGKFKSNAGTLTKGIGQGFSKALGFSLKGTISNLQKEKDRLLDEMRSQRAEKHTPVFDVEGALAGLEPKAAEAGEKLGTQAAESIATALDMGRVGFAEAGRKLQDEALKGEGDSKTDKLLGKQVGIGEVGLKKQDALLEAVKNIAPAGLT